jgi:hypothetical protein
LGTHPPCNRLRVPIWNQMDAVAMPISDVVIHRFAHLFVHIHGDEAMAKAREMVEQMRRKGDHGDADTWLQIVLEIGEFARANHGRVALGCYRGKVHG